MILENRDQRVAIIRLRKYTVLRLIEKEYKLNGRIYSQ